MPEGPSLFDEGPNDGFADRIGLDPEWPRQTKLEGMSVIGRLRWASAYLYSASILNIERDKNSMVFAGPLMQVAGIATELTFKALHLGSGKTEKQVRSYGHNCVKAFDDASDIFDHDRHAEWVYISTLHIKMPVYLHKAFVNDGAPAEYADKYWKFYPLHIRQMGRLYDKPFRSRYGVMWGFLQDCTLSGDAFASIPC